jgi:hypothetical protein
MANRPISSTTNTDASTNTWYLGSVVYPKLDRWMRNNSLRFALVESTTALSVGIFSSTVIDISNFSSLRFCVAIDEKQLKDQFLFRKRTNYRNRSTIIDRKKNPPFFAFRNKLFFFFLLDRSVCLEFYRKQKEQEIFVVRSIKRVSKKSILEEF